MDSLEHSGTEGITNEELSIIDSLLNTKEHVYAGLTTETVSPTLLRAVLCASDSDFYVILQCLARRASLNIDETLWSKAAVQELYNWLGSQAHSTDWLEKIRTYPLYYQRLLEIIEAIPYCNNGQEVVVLEQIRQSLQLDPTITPYIFQRTISVSSKGLSLLCEEELTLQDLTVRTIDKLSGLCTEPEEVQIYWQDYLQLLQHRACCVSALRVLMVYYPNAVTIEMVRTTAITLQQEDDDAIRDLQRARLKRLVKRYTPDIMNEIFEGQA